MGRENQESRFRRLVISAVAVAALTLSTAAQDFEAPPRLLAQDLVGEELLSGPYHHVDEEVSNDGRMNHFLIRSDFGDFLAGSEPYGGTVAWRSPYGSPRTSESRAADRSAGPTTAASDS